MRTLTLIAVLAVATSAQEVRVVRGIVVDANNAPVEGAIVVLDRAYPARPDSSVLQTKTDDHGKQPRAPGPTRCGEGKDAGKGALDVDL